MVYSLFLLQFLKEYFLLYKDLLAKEIIISKNEIGPNHFKNIVSVGNTMNSSQELLEMVAYGSENNLGLSLEQVAYIAYFCIWVGYGGYGGYEGI